MPITCRIRFAGSPKQRGEVPEMEKTMTTRSMSLLAMARLRMSTGAFAGPRCADLIGRVHGTSVPTFGYTPAIVDVVQGDAPGVQAWSPPV